MDRKLAFVLTDNSAKVSEHQRGLIRSHCMRLKNKQPNSRRSRQEAKRLHAHSRKERKDDDDDDANTGAIHPQTKDGHPQFDEEPWAISKPLIVPTRIPLPLAHELAVYPFPVVLDRSSQALFHRCACLPQDFLAPVRRQITWANEADRNYCSILDMPCNPVRDAVFPFKLFNIQVDVQADRPWLAGLLASDELFFRATIVMASVSDDLVAGRSASSQTQRRLQHLLPLLNKRLALQKSPWDTVALFVIGILASVATLCGDYASAAMHSKGIDEILRLRGRDLRAQDMMLSLALERLSFASSLLTDQWSPINMVAERIAPRFSEQVLLTYGAREMLQPDFIPDGRLIPVFHALQCTTIILDTHEFGATSINGVLLSQAMGFVQSELLDLRTQVRDGLSSLILLSLLAFHATTFRLPGLYEHPCCSVLAGSLLESFCKNERGVQMLPDAMRTWLILIGALTAKGDEARMAAWRRYCTGAVSEGPWETIRQEARKVMWIDSIHNDVGRTALSMLQA